ncbi:MAG TPA: cyclic nucleotide-binding domain-containing protein [Acidimicrobiales bacterium]|jgi:CRP-like cAMP-binding protein|nr:cyclic nucleotide-binding domain-containing protein [Acidimicrobiales bacterium]
MRRTHSQTIATSDLLQIPGFSACTPKQLAEIDRLTDRSVALPGRVLVRENSYGNELFIILSGTARVSRAGRLVTTLGCGDHFGELGAIGLGQRDATLTALSVLSVLIVGPREFTTLMADVPGFRDALLRGMARRLRAADDTIETMAEIQDSLPLAAIYPIRGARSLVS